MVYLCELRQVVDGVGGELLQPVLDASSVHGTEGGSGRHKHGEDSEETGQSLADRMPLAGTWTQHRAGKG